jgi:hemoglobin-like flavoprotein
MFQGNVTKQGQMLASLLKFLVKAIGNEPEFTTTLQYMAMLHNTLGVTTQHYSLMGIILVDTVASCLCSGFTDDVRSAWITTYSAMMNVMIPIVEAGTRVNDQWMAKNSHKLLPEYRPDDDDGGSGKGRYKLSRPSSPLDEDHKPKKGSHSEGEPRNLTPTKRRSQFKAVPLSPAVMQLSASGPNDDGLTTDHSMESIDPDSGSRSRSSNVGRVSGFKDDEKSDPPTV